MTNTQRLYRTSHAQPPLPGLSHCRAAAPGALAFSAARGAKSADEPESPFGGRAGVYTTPWARTPEGFLIVRSVRTRNTTMSSGSGPPSAPFGASTVPPLPVNRHPLTAPAGLRESVLRSTQASHVTRRGPPTGPDPYSGGVPPPIFR